jgi:hypothetical protein
LKLYVVIQYQDAALGTFVLLPIQKLPTASIAIRPIVNKSNTSNVHQIEISPNYFDRFKDSFNPSIALVLQVFKRNTLPKQLEAASKQTLIPSTIVQYQDAALGTFVLLPMHLHRSHFERRQSYLVSVFV